MADELIDHLDENGNIIGKIMKSEAHRTGAWHRAVHIYLINNKKQLLMQLRSKDKDIAPNVWDISIGGHIDAGEDSLSTAQRELKEELGVDAEKKDFKFLFTIKEILKNNNFISCEFVDVFLIWKNVTEKDIIIQEEEVSEFRFVDVEEFIKKVKEKDEKFQFHPEEYTKVIPILQKEVLGDKEK